MSQDDKKIRQKLKEKDIDLSKQLQKQMRIQQDMLKDYFKQYKKPIKQDPTIVSNIQFNFQKKEKASTQDKTQIYKQAFKPFKLFSMFYDFWTMQCATSQQKYALKIAKDNIKSNVLTCLLGSMFITSITSYKMRMYIGWPMHLFGFCTAIASGFEKLGQGYQLGRMAIAEIQKYRMDKTV